MNEVINHKYILREQIGSGGMAHVYKAETVSGHRTVAVKLLKEEYLNDRELLRRFQKEGKASQRLRHENIVRAYDVGEYEHVPYIVFEYVEGQTIEDIIKKRGKLPSQEAVALCCQILDALQYAHEHGLIHRDIKPQNVIVNEHGIAKLTDFGIAREVSASTLTFDGKNVIGSVHYISPEQARGERVSEASDIYSVGITLYEMLTGEVPFKGETAVATAIMQINDIPRAPMEIDREVPYALNEIVLKAIEKEPLARYHHARSMKRDLVRSLSDPQGDFVTAEKVAKSKTDRPRRKIDGLLLGIVLSVFIPLIVLIAIYIGYNRKVETAPKETEMTAATHPKTLEVPLSAIEPAVTKQEKTEQSEQSSTGFDPSQVVGMRLDEALLMLQKNGTTDIYVIPAYDADEASLGVITRVEQREDAVLLTLGRGARGKYKADVSFTVSIPENQTSAMLVYKTSGDSGVDYRYVLYDSLSVKEEDVTISATLYSSDEATRTVFLLLNGEEIRSQEVKFS